MQTIETKYLPATNTKQSRIKATASGATTDKKRQSVTVGYNSSNTPDVDAALQLARKLGWSGTLIQGGTREGSVFVFADDKRHHIPTAETV